MTALSNAPAWEMLIILVVPPPRLLVAVVRSWSPCMWILVVAVAVAVDFAVDFIVVAIENF